MQTNLKSTIDRRTFLLALSAAATAAAAGAPRLDTFTQLTAGHGQDGRVIRTAIRLEQLLGREARASRR
jgi:hypothetical protein